MDRGIGMSREFRRLYVSDLAMALRMNEDFRPNFLHEESARAFLADPACWLLACIEDGRVLGFCYGYEMRRLDANRKMLYIHEVGVLPAFHRQGIGREMLRTIQTLCRHAGLLYFFLFTQASNKPACALYEAMGGEHGNPDDVTYFFNDL